VGRDLTHWPAPLVGHCGLDLEEGVQDQEHLGLTHHLTGSLTSVIILTLRNTKDIEMLITLAILFAPIALMGVALIVAGEF
jgi:hypothetical protein